MATEIMVCISPRMFVEDVEVLRSCLESYCPAGWTERRATDDEDGLAVADLVLTALLAGAAEAMAKAAIDGIHDKIQQLARRYPETEPPPATVEATTATDVIVHTVDAADAGPTETPYPPVVVESAGSDRDAI